MQREPSLIARRPRGQVQDIFEAARVASSDPGKRFAGLRGERPPEMLEVKSTVRRGFDLFIHAGSLSPQTDETRYLRVTKKALCVQSLDVFSLRGTFAYFLDRESLERVEVKYFIVSEQEFAALS